MGLPSSLEDNEERNLAGREVLESMHASIAGAIARLPRDQEMRLAREYVETIAPKAPSKPKPIELAAPTKAKKSQRKKIIAKMVAKKDRAMRRWFAKTPLLSTRESIIGNSSPKRSKERS